nr:uncharacterized protein LOC128676311 [Plodia interpunctella]
MFHRPRVCKFKWRSFHCLSYFVTTIIHISAGGISLKNKIKLSKSLNCEISVSYPYKYYKCESLYRLDCGVRQGGLTSPRLFNLYIDALIDELSSKRVGCSVGGVSINNISYADDMVLLGPSVKAIRELLKVCEAYAESHGLTYNVKKCEYMVFEVRGKHREDGPDLLLNGFKIKKVSSFKYLGHVIADDLKDNLDIERERRALAVRSNMLARRFARCTDQVKITLFKSYCQSLYTGNLWVNYTKKTLDILRVQYNNAFRMLLGLPRYCSASEMFAQARTDGFHAIIRKKTASLLRRVRDSPNGILRTVAENNYSPILRKFYCILTLVNKSWY